MLFSYKRRPFPKFHLRSDLWCRHLYSLSQGQRQAEIELAQAEVLAKIESVSTEVALARLRSQVFTGELVEILKKRDDIGFAGMWQDRGKELVQHISLKNVAGSEEVDNLAIVKDLVEKKLSG
jgi:hypothetical protein